MAFPTAARGSIYELATTKAPGFGNNSNFSMESNMTDPNADFVRVVGIIVPLIFGIIAVLGFVGNMLVIIVVVANRQMRNTTNLLIINLAVADLLFILICVPFTAMAITMPAWPFGHYWCKIYRYTINVTAYESVYTLVLMSLDRYLAVVHPIRSMTIRTERNATIIIILSWALILASTFPMALEFKAINYSHYGELRTACLNEKIWWDGLHGRQDHGRKFYGCFFAFGYLIPLTAVCVLYGFMLRRLLYRMVPGGNKSAESLRSKKRVTKMVVVVVLIFALCWLPIQIIHLAMYFGEYPQTLPYLAIQIASNCFAYMNSCVNPFLYAFLSDNFRKSFRRLLCCYSKFQPVKLQVEKTTTRGLEPVTRSTALNNNDNSNCL